MKSISPQQPNSPRPRFIFLKEMAIALSTLILPVVFPSTVHAGLFSFIASLAGSTASAQETAASAQHKNYLQTDGGMAFSKPLNELAISGDALAPSVGPSGSIADIEAKPSNTSISTYVVRQGDTLSLIASLFGVSVNTIVWANDLGSHPTISPGQTLVILPVTGINYVVKKGDSISSIVAKYKADLNEVLEFNDITVESKLAVGDTIIIPDAELAAPAVSSGKRLSVGYEPYLGGGGPLIPDYFIRPIDGGHKSQGLHGHNAVDLAAPVGTPIHASAAGTVIISRSNGAYNGGYGNFVVISHPNGTQTLYAHMQKTAVAVGQQVAQGETVGYIGMTGLTTGPHVHFEIRGAANPF